MLGPACLDPIDKSMAWLDGGVRFADCLADVPDPSLELSQKSTCLISSEWLDRTRRRKPFPPLLLV